MGAQKHDLRPGLSMSGRKSERAPEPGSRQYGPIVRPNLDHPYMALPLRFGKTHPITGPFLSVSHRRERRRSCELYTGGREKPVLPFARPGNTVMAATPGAPKTTCRVRRARITGPARRSRAHAKCSKMPARLRLPRAG